MKTYKLYFVVTALFLGTMLLGFIENAFSLRGTFSTLMFYGLYAYLFLGIFQLLTGLYLLSAYKKYPDWVRGGIRNYWLITGIYFLTVFMALAWGSLTDFPWMLWFVLSSLGIAAYQIRLVWRMAGLRRRQLEKRLFLKLYNH